MRKYILLFIVLCLHGMARGQTQGYSYHYWFDDDPTTLQHGTSETDNWQLQPDASELSESLHAIHVVVHDEEGRQSLPMTRLFLRFNGLADQAEAYYWFDVHEGQPTKADILNGTFDVDVSSLSEGLHAIYFLAQKRGGAVTTPQIRYFLKMPKDPSVVPLQGYYWFDSSTKPFGPISVSANTFDVDASSLSDGFHQFHYAVSQNGNAYSSPVSKFFLKASQVAEEDSLQGLYWFDKSTKPYGPISVSANTFDVDASSLSDGFHQFHYAVSQGGSAYSSPVSKYFMKVTQVAEQDSLTCLCSVDGQLAHVEKLPCQGGVIHWDLDMYDIPDGIHRIQLMAITKSGAMCNSFNTYFIRATTSEELGQMRCLYAIDGSAFDADASIVGENGNYHFDLDLSALADGLHSISYMLYNDRGTSTKVQTRFFIKTPEGGNGLGQYQYWLNDDDISQAKTVTLEKKTNPLQLMALLPVESRPLRSSLFHFEVEDGKPMMYAKNTIHLRFYDASMRFSDAAKEFVDYKVGQEVHPVGELHETQTFDRLAENDIRWYTMQSAPGDTVAFRLSQAATIQVFAPSGAEVFKTSESASVKWDGIHTWEDGTYYLAVHDVTGSKAEMTLDYMHMDKYDVVDWDVHTVGNGGCSTITFKGNGFRDLYAVDLVVAPGDTIHSVDVSHDSDAETAVTFDFTDATLGDYNAVFHFTEEDKHVANVVTVEEAVDIELATDVTFPSSFLRGTSTTYTIKITNKGNMMAYRVPFYLYISSLTEKSISKISIEGLKLPSLFDIINNDSLPESERIQLANYSKEIGEDHYFVEQKVKDEVSTDSICVKSGYFCTDISPCSIKTITITIESKDNVECWVTMPDEWPSIAYDLDSKKIKSRRHRAESNSDSWYCCYHERIECLVNGFATATGMGGPILSCLGNFASISVNWATDHFCGKEDNSEEKNAWDKIHSWMDGLSKAGVLTCWNPLGKITGTIQVIMHPVIVTDCITAFAKKKPNCPPKPPTGGSSTPRPPSDPNDIFGPLSETGSKFIADSVARVNYTIEFENDTTFAEAAAHTIVIKDTLDSKYFDLTKFMPTGVRIGSREVFLDEADVVTKNNVTSFVKTIDMRPEINAIAQVDGTFNKSTGIAEWRFQSLDPMTMEPTDDLMQGILPVNYNGTSGIGEVMFEVGMKQGKADGTQINNRAGIVFDYEETILTPTWTNIVDAVAPSSVIDNSWMVNDSTLRITADGFDERSGVWKYTWYVQAGENAPWWNEGETESPQFDYHIFEGIDYGFCVLATDSAGNVEQKVIERERSFKTYGQDFEDGISPLPTSPEEEENVNGKWYDLSGRRHDEPQENQVNIVGRKKILFRKSDKVKR